MDLSLDNVRRDGKALDCIYNITELFECFETGAACSLLRTTYDTGFKYSKFSIPVSWLTFLVIRSGPQSNVENVLRRLSSTKLLGKLRLDFVERLRPFKMSSAPDTNKSTDQADLMP